MTKNAEDLTEQELNELVAKIANSETRAYATDPSLGMPILEQAGISLRHAKGVWYAMSEAESGTSAQVDWARLTAMGGKRYGTHSYQVHKRIRRFTGPTMLIAGLRCFVATSLPEEVNVYDFSD